MPHTDRHIVLTQGAMFNLAGSEVVAFELASYFAERGDRVTFAALGISDRWARRLAALPGVEAFRVDDPALDARLRDTPPDLAWVHHQVLPPAVLEELSTPVVFHHMSAFQPQEFPIARAIESALASLVLFPAEETRTAIAGSGALDAVDPERLRVFGNPAPDAYARLAGTAEGAPLRRIVVVSNHVPEELAAAVLRLRDDVVVDVIGESDLDGARKELVTPEVVDGYDAIVSIGKTVQYGVVSGTPVYCYDHFGGPGWLTPSNFEAARSRNFSGRGFDRKSSEEIGSEIVGGFEQATRDAALLRASSSREFLMSTAMDRIWDGIGPIAREPIAEGERAAYGRYLEVMNGLVNALEARNQTVEYLTDRTRIAEEQLASVQQRLDDAEALLATHARTPLRRITGRLRRAFPAA